MTARRALSLLALLVGLAGCTKEDSLVLLDLRTSGPLGAPVARVRLSATGWPTRTIDASIDTAGFRVGYYGPGDGSGVTVTADALDAFDCVLGRGSATAPSLKAGETSAPLTLFVRPQPANGCVPDAGTEDAGTDAGEEAGTDAGEDAGMDAPVDAGTEVDSGGEDDVGTDAAPDAGAPDVTPDAGGPDGGAPDADDDAHASDATVD